MGYQSSNATSLDQYDKFHIQDLLSLGFNPYEIYGIAEKMGWWPRFVEEELKILGYPLERYHNDVTWSSYVKIPRKHKSTIKQFIKAIR